MIDILVASNNLDKIREYKEIFNDYPINIYSLKDLNINSEPKETGSTYTENALIKAKALINKTSYYILADDSGIEFEALGEHFPGINTHRYAISNGGNKVLNLKLAKEIGGTKACFYCALVLITPLKEIHSFLGIAKGRVSHVCEGNNGFGYDPIFIPDGEEHTNAYFLKEYKNKISHRAKACELMIDFLKKEKLL